MGADNIEHNTAMSAANTNRETRSDNCNMELLAELGSKLIGKQRIDDFCKETGLSRSYVSRLLNKRLDAKPRRRSILRMFGNYANERNGVTINDLLTAAGYDSEKGNLSDETTTQYADDGLLSLSDSIAIHYAENPTFGLSLFLNALIKMHYEHVFTIAYQPGMFTVKPNSEEHVLCVIPAFCYDPQGLKAVVLSALSRIIMALNFPHNLSNTYYFIMTNRKEIFDEFRNYKVIENMKLSVLLVGNQENEIKNQYLITSYGIFNEERELLAENFPIVLI